MSGCSPCLVLRMFVSVGKLCPLLTCHCVHANQSCCISIILLCFSHQCLMPQQPLNSEWYNESSGLQSTRAFKLCAAAFIKALIQVWLWKCTPSNKRKIKAVLLKAELYEPFMNLLLWRVKVNITLIFLSFLVYIFTATAPSVPSVLGSCSKAGICVDMG